MTGQPAHLFPPYLPLSEGEGGRVPSPPMYCRHRQSGSQYIFRQRHSDIWQTHIGQSGAAGRRGIRAPARCQGADAGAHRGRLLFLAADDHAAERTQRNTPDQWRRHRPPGNHGKLIRHQLTRRHEEQQARDDAVSQKLERGSGRGGRTARGGSPTEGGQGCHGPKSGAEAQLDCSIDRCDWYHFAYIPLSLLSIDRRRSRSVL